METFADVYDQQVRPVMDKIDEVRALFSMKKYDVDFPSVIVVGDQSSGKSTLLESLSSIELPKGGGTVTRCPLILRLRRSTERRVYRIHGDEKILLDEKNSDIPKYIEDETKKLAGDEKNIVEVGNVIELQVENPDVRNLTVIDLPGIARIALRGQPEDIDKKTTNLIRHYIREESSVILCVHSADVDIGTAESFKLAKEVDPKHIRTIGVITKSDLAPDPEKLVRQLAMNTNDVLHLKLGFIAVRNRSTHEKISLEDARKREKDFFMEHPASTAVGVGWGRLGIDALMNHLAVLYSDRVKEKFPKLKLDIQAEWKKTYDTLLKLPPDLETPVARLKKYYELAEIYVEKILQVRINGSKDGRRVSMINILHEQFTAFEANICIQNRQLWSPEYRARVKTEMSVYFGEHLPNFPPESILKHLVYEKLDQLWNSINSLINSCFDKTFETLLNDEDEICQNNVLLRKLMPIFQTEVTKYMQEKKQAVHNLLNELLQIENQNPYTTNHYYSGTVNKFKKHIRQQKSVNPTSKVPSVLIDDTEELEIFNAISNDEESVQHIIISVYSYWKVLQKRFIDYAALSLRANCAFNVCSVIRERLGQVSDKEYSLVEKCLADNASYRIKREELQRKRETLKKAYAICQDNDTIDMMSTTNDSKMAFSLTLENVSSTTSNSVIGDSAYPCDPILEGWATTVPKNFEFPIVPDKKKTDH